MEFLEISQRISRNGKGIKSLEVRVLKRIEGWKKRVERTWFSFVFSF
jgi:hypothetical protein